MSTPARQRLREATINARTAINEDGETIDALTVARAKHRLPGLRRVIKHGRTAHSGTLRILPPPPLAPR